MNKSKENDGNVLNKFCGRSYFAIKLITWNIESLLNKTHYFSMIDKGLKLNEKENKKTFEYVKCNFQNLNG